MKIEAGKLYAVITGDIVDSSKLLPKKRQHGGVLHIKKVGRINNSDYQRLTVCIRNTAARDLDGLVEKGVLERIGEKRGAYYVMARRK